MILNRITVREFASKIFRLMCLITVSTAKRKIVYILLGLPQEIVYLINNSTLRAEIFVLCSLGTSVEVLHHSFILDLQIPSYYS